LKSKSAKDSDDQEQLTQLSESIVDVKADGRTLADFIADIGTRLVNTARYGAQQIEVPDDHTTIIAVAGTLDPVLDDWIVADLCLLRRTFGGTAQKETWLTAFSLVDFVAEHGKIVHGSPYKKPRRVCSVKRAMTLRPEWNQKF
jgi:hypothetical protein